MLDHVDPVFTGWTASLSLMQPSVLSPHGHVFMRQRRPYTALTPCALAAMTNHAQAAQKFCVFDFLGASGDLYSMAKDYALAMQRYNVDVELKAYSNEAVATEDFRTGNCDAFIATAFRTRQFNPVAASIDAMDATTIVRNGKIDMPAAYEVGGIVPIGPAYPFVNDRRINSVEALVGKRIAAFDYDKAQAVMIQRIGAQPVSADVTNPRALANGRVLTGSASSTACCS